MPGPQSQGAGELESERRISQRRNKMENASMQIGAIFDRNESWTMLDKRQGKRTSTGEYIWQNRQEDMTLKDKGRSQSTKASRYAWKDTEKVMQMTELGDSQQGQEATLWQKGPRRRGVSKWRSGLRGVELTGKSMVESGDWRKEWEDGSTDISTLEKRSRGRKHWLGGKGVISFPLLF